MLVIALTGGIGCGKSTVANIFQEHGIPVIDTDQIAYDITQKGGRMFEKVASHFGKSVLNDAGDIDRKSVREIIFNDPKEKEWIEKTLHPEILADLKDLLSQIDSPYCIVIIPLLAQITKPDFITHVITVDAPLSIQKSRLQRRDHHSTELIDKIIQSQAGRMDMLEIADDIILNADNLPNLTDQVEKLHGKYSALAHQTPALDENGV